MKKWRRYGCFCFLINSVENFQRILFRVPRFSAFWRVSNFLWLAREAASLKPAEATERTYRTESRNPSVRTAQTYLKCQQCYFDQIEYISPSKIECKLHLEVQIFV